MTNRKTNLLKKFKSLGCENINQFCQTHKFTYSLIWNIANSPKKLPTGPNLRRLSKVLGMTPGELIDYLN